MSPNCTVTDTIQNAILTDDQQNACERLLALARVRSSTTEAALSPSVLGRWSVPLLIGPAGVGKAFVCEEVARRLGNQPFRRWDVGSWIITSNRTSHTTPEQIQAFIENHPLGCVVYLAGVDALAQVEHNVSYYRAMAGEIEQLLDRVSARPVCFTRSNGSVIPANVLLVAGGCFAALWGEAAVGGPSGREMWKLADQEALADPSAVANWLLGESGLPASILRRVASEPTVLRPLGPEEAGRLATRLRDHLPPALDGIRTEEFRAALQSPHGWRAVAALIERAWVEGHVDLPLPEASAAAQVTQNPSPAPPGAKLVASQPPARLGERLGIPSNRSRLLGTARRLGLGNAFHLESLAVARGYFLPGEDAQRRGAPERVSRDEFSDTQLTAALLSPCLEFSERAICRGALMLSAQLATTIKPISIVCEADRARGGTVVRHVARIGCELEPQCKPWRDLLVLLPSLSDRPAFAPGIMPDEAIRGVLSVPRLW